MAPPIIIASVLVSSLWISGKTAELLKSLCRNKFLLWLSQTSALSFLHQNGILMKVPSLGDHCFKILIAKRKSPNVLFEHILARTAAVVLSDMSQTTQFYFLNMFYSPCYIVCYTKISQDRSSIKKNRICIFLIFGGREIQKQCTPSFKA